MRKLLLIIGMIFLLAVPVSAAEITAPVVPPSGTDLMPEDTGNFWDGLMEILTDAVRMLRPDLAEAARICGGVMAIVLLISLFRSLPGAAQHAVDLAGAVSIGILLLKSTGTMVILGTNTTSELSAYGKLLLPVMTSAMAAQGGITASAALYTGSAAFNVLLSNLISKLLIPMLYIFLALSAANAAAGEDTLKKMRDFVKWLIVWCLKTVLYIFTGYMSITGVVSGATDAAALKATKLTISGMVPVVGGILSDASEAVLVGAGVVKNTAGIYGMLAVLAVFTGPFLKIGMHYLMLKATGAVSSIFGSKQANGLLQDFTAAMGLLLAMTGAVCLLLLISTVCFLREVG